MRLIVSRDDRRGVADRGETASDHAARDDREVGCQRTIAPKSTQHGEIARHERQEYLGHQIVASRLIQRDPSRDGRVVGDVNHQPQKPIDKIHPGPRRLIEAPLQEDTINLGKTH